MRLKIILFFFAVVCLSCNKQETKKNNVPEKTTDSKKDQKEKIEQIIKKYSNTKYHLTEQRGCDLNNDGVTDLILIFANNEDVLSGFPETYIAPIVVLLSNASNYMEFCNYNIYPNNFGDFFEQFFEANSLDKGLTKIAHEGGRAHGLLNVTPSDFFSLKIAIPSFEEQTAIAQVLQTADKEIQLLKAKTEKLREQKKGMMQVLLTGKKRLKINTH